MPSPLLRVIEGVLQGRVQVKQLEDALKQRRYERKRQDLETQLLERKLSTPAPLKEWEYAQQNPEAYARYQELKRSPKALTPFEQWKQDPEGYAKFKEVGRQPTEYDRFRENPELFGEYRRAGQRPTDFELFQNNREQYEAFKRVGQRPTDFELFQQNPELFAEYRRSGRALTESELFQQSPEQYRAYIESKRLPATERDKAMVEYYNRRTELLGQDKPVSEKDKAITEWYKARTDSLNNPQSKRESLSDQLRRVKARDEMTYHLFDTITAKVDLPTMLESLGAIRQEAVALGIDLTQLWNQMEVISTQPVLGQDGEVLEEGMPLYERLGDSYANLRRQFFIGPSTGTLGEYGPPLPPGGVSLNTSPYPDGFDPNMPIPNGRPQKPVPTGWNVPGYGDGMSESEVDALLDAMLRMEGR